MNPAKQSINMEKMVVCLIWLMFTQINNFCYVAATCLTDFTGGAAAAIFTSKSNLTLKCSHWAQRADYQHQ